MLLPRGGGVRGRRVRDGVMKFNGYVGDEGGGRMYEMLYDLMVMLLLLLLLQLPTTRPLSRDGLFCPSFPISVATGN
jgi:hypothetical protein